jgi:hypothetical protein
MSDDQNTVGDELDNNEALATAARATLEIPSFPQFKRLPIELRLHIWSLDRPKPRLVCVQYDEKLKQFYSSAPLPAHLLVCSESRSEAKKQYPLRFATKGSPAMVRVNFEVDTIQLHHWALNFGAVSSGDVKATQFLELSGAYYTSEDMIHDTFKSLLAFHSMKQLTVTSPGPQALQQHLGDDLMPERRARIVDNLFQQAQYLYNSLLLQFFKLRKGDSLDGLDGIKEWRGRLEAMAWLEVSEDGSRHAPDGVEYWENTNNGFSNLFRERLGTERLNGSGFCNVVGGRL